MSADPDKPTGRWCSRTALASRAISRADVIWWRTRAGKWRPRSVLRSDWPVLQMPKFGAAEQRSALADQNWPWPERPIIVAIGLLMATSKAPQTYAPMGPGSGEIRPDSFGKAVAVWHLINEPFALRSPARNIFCADGPTKADPRRASRPVSPAASFEFEHSTISNILTSACLNQVPNRFDRRPTTADSRRSRVRRRRGASGAARADARPAAPTGDLPCSLTLSAIVRLVTPLY
jgi:hypothetical protein